MSTSQNIYAIKDRAPEFPCWLWYADWEYWVNWSGHTPQPANASHWSPDAPEAPKDAPDSKPIPSDVPREEFLENEAHGAQVAASPELPESVRQAVNHVLLEVYDSLGTTDINEPKKVCRMAYKRLIEELTPLWPSADKPPTLGAMLVAAREHRDRPTPTPSQGAGLPTPERIAQLEGLLKAVQFQRDESDKALAAARAEVDQLRRYVASAPIPQLQDDVADLRAQLATAKEELSKWLEWSKNECPDETKGDVVAADPDGYLTLDDGITIWNPMRAAMFMANENTRLRSDLAKANAAVEELKADREQLQRYRAHLREKIYVDATPDPEMPIRILSAHIDESTLDGSPEVLTKMMNGWQVERNAILRAAIAQLAAQQSVPPAGSKYVPVKPGADVSGMESDGASYTFKPDSK